MGEMTRYVWNDKFRNFDAKIIQDPIIKIEKDKNGSFDIKVTPEGQKCHFLQFLINASNFFWDKKQKDETVTLEEAEETVMHIAAKITAIGYLLHNYDSKSMSRAIIAMDGKLSEVGSSNGRTGKSLFGLAIEHMQPYYIYWSQKQKNNGGSFPV